MPKKTQKEFIQLAQDNLFFEYQRLRSNLNEVLKKSPLPDFYKAETLFDLVREIREEN